MDTLTNLVCINWMIPVFIVTSLGIIANPVGAGHRVHAEQLAGTFLGQAVLRCTVSPQDQEIHHVQWFIGTKEIYFDTLHPNPNTKPGPGYTFKGRNITGAFGLKLCSHELKIERALMGDEGLYRCEIYTKTNRSALWYHGNVNLTLVVPTDSPPSITDVRGVKVETSNCSDSRAIPVKNVPASTSFVCRVGGSNPGPYVEWYHNGSSRIHAQTSITYSRRGVSVKNASRKIDVLTSNSSIRCVVLIPDVKPGALKKKEMCLVVIHTVMSTSLRSNQSLVIGLSVSLTIAAVLLSLSITLVTIYKIKRKIPCGVTETGVKQNLLLGNPGGNQDSVGLNKIDAFAEESDDTHALKQKLANLCYPFNWGLFDHRPNNLNRIEEAAKEWTSVDCNKQSQAAKVIVAYTTFLKGDGPGAITQLKEITTTHPYLPALACMAHIYYQKGNYSKCKEELDLIDKECDDISVSESMYAKAFAFLQVSDSIWNKKAYRVLKELREKDRSDPVVLLDLIFTMCRLVRAPDTTQSTLNKLGGYVLDAFKLKNIDKQMICTHILRLDVATRCTLAGEEWMDKFTRDICENIRLEECAKFHPNHPKDDIRNLYTFACRISYYDQHGKFEEATDIYEEAISEFPDNNSLMVRGGRSYLEYVKKIFHCEETPGNNKNTASDRQSDYICRTIRIFESLCKKDLCDRHKIFAMLGAAYYMNNQYSEAYKAFKQALTCAEFESAIPSDVAQIHVDWCKILQMCSKAVVKIPFSHARASLQLTDTVSCDQKIQAMRDALREKLQENKESSFYLLLNGYLELFVSLNEAERLFKYALDLKKNWDTYVAMTEVCIQRGQIPRAKTMLAKAEKCEKPVDDEAFQDHNAAVQHYLDMDASSSGNQVELQNREGGRTVKQENWMDTLESKCHQDV